VQLAVLETETTWIWIGYYSLTLASLLASIFCVMTKRIVRMSWLHMAVIVSGYAIFLYHSTGRSIDQTEYGHLAVELINGSYWAIYVLVGYLYTVAWWIRFIAAIRRK
jgi:hypothetical protein